MIKSKKKFTALLLAVLTLMVAGAAGFAQRHLMLAKAARPEVKIELSAAVERDSALVPLDKATEVKPGKPLWFGVGPGRGEAPPALVFGLPGNPVSGLVGFLLFIRPALDILSGAVHRAAHCNALVRNWRMLSLSTSRSLRRRRKRCASR